MLKIWINDFETVQRFKKEYNFKHNLYNGSKTFQSLLKGLNNPTGHPRYKDLCQMVICELNKLDYKILDLNYSKFKNIFVELCLSDFDFIKQIQNVMNETSLSEDYRRQYLQTVKNGVI